MNYHNAPDYLLNPPHKITVALIGCGGTGSQVLSILARMNKALVALGHLGLQVTAYDDDIISEANIGRQLYSESEIGEHKATALITRFNRFYGTKWEAINTKFSIANQYNITISCVDDFNTRLMIGKMLRKKPEGTHNTTQLYWLDFGNTNNAGQAILGTLFKSDKPLECFDKWASLYNKPKKSKNTPSCSLAEALEKQDLLINSSLANAGTQLLWRLFREGKTPYKGVMINLETLSSNPINV